MAANPNRPPSRGTNLLLLDAQVLLATRMRLPCFVAALALLLGCRGSAGAHDLDSGTAAADGGVADAGLAVDDGGAADAGGGAPDGGPNQVDGGKGTDAGPTWEPVPLRTQAQKTAGIPGGEGMQQIFAMAYAPSRPSVVYFVVDTSQVWKSTDEGEHWQMKHHGFIAGGGYSLAVDPRNENVVLVYGNNMSSGGRDHPGSAKGIYRTTDGGDSWRLARPAALGRNPGQDARGGCSFSFAGSGVVFAGSQAEGLLKSTDGGATWSKVSLPALDGDSIYDVRTHPDDPSVAFVSSYTDGKLYRMTGSGSSAVPTGSGLPSAPASMAISANGNQDTMDDILYAAVGAHGVYKSTDGGQTFAASNSGLSAALAAGTNAMYLEMSPVDGAHLYVTFNQGRYFYSQNGGAQWQSPVSMDEMNADGWLSGSLSGVTASGGNYWGGPVAAHPRQRGVALTMGGIDDVRRTTDGGAHWRYSSSGYSGGRAGDRVNGSSLVPYAWDVGQASRMVVFLLDYGPFLTADNGSTFRFLNIPRYRGARSTVAGALEPVAGSEVVVTAVGEWYQQTLAMTRNANAARPTWTLFNTTTLDDAYTFIAFNPQDTNVIYAGRYRSIDKGNTWSLQQRKVVAMYSGDGDIVYATQVGMNETSILKSTDRGTTWASPYRAIPAITSVGSIAVSPIDPDRLYVAAMGKGVYVIDHSTLSLKEGVNGLSKDAFQSISTSLVAVDPRAPRVVYAGAWTWLGNSNGIFRSVDGGETWTNITGSLGPEFNVWSLAVSPHDGFVYVGSSHGTWRFPPPP